MAADCSCFLSGCSRIPSTRAPSQFAAAASTSGAPANETYSNFSLPSSARMRSCSSMTGSMASWPRRSASSIRSSGSSSAPASTIRMASLVPAMRRSSVDAAICSTVGLMTNAPSMKPTRTAPIGPSQGMSERCTAALAPMMPRTSRCSSGSRARAVTITCTSFMKPLGKSGRSGRSIRRLIRMAWSLRRPSRRWKLPGMRPAA